MENHILYINIEATGPFHQLEHQKQKIIEQEGIASLKNSTTCEQCKVKYVNHSK